jgi:phosphodiesterase/alkaline phosphatase D-like protein
MARDGDELDGLNRRELLAAGAVLGAALATGSAAAPVARAATEERLDFTTVADGDGWPGWTTHGVANLRRAKHTGILEAGSDVFPYDPRPVAFALDRRFADGEITATLTHLGAGPGVVLRRPAPDAYYAAILIADAGLLVIARRRGSALDQLARGVVPATIVRRLSEGTATPVTLALAAHGRDPTVLTARLEIPGAPAAVLTAQDETPELQAPGDPGVLATAQTLLPSEGPPVLPALGNLHLLPYGVQEGQAFLNTGAGRGVLDTIRERSTVAFAAIAVRTTQTPRPTTPSAVAATTGAPLRGGAILRVLTDVPARVRIEVAADPAFRTHRRTLSSRLTNDRQAVLARVTGLPHGRTVHWRARLRRHGVETLGPTRSFRVLPAAGSPQRVRLAIAACASQFGPIFDVLTRAEPDVFVWQGDLNYPDTVGPLAQTVSGYAGIWRDFQANPRLARLLDTTAFAVQRDDHDYGVQDANSTNLVPWGLEPWEALMEARPYHRFTAGLAEVWVLDQRRAKSDPELPDTPEKTLLGPAQRAWLLRTLAASRAPLKVICSPCTLAPLPANARDGSWATGFTKERDIVLDHIAANVRGTTIFVTGDTHWTMAYERDGLFEARPCPLGIPTPNDITLTDPQAAESARKQPGVLYADDDRGHFAVLDVSGDRRTATLALSLVREDGATVFGREFRQLR